MDHHQDTYVHGSALAELAHLIKCCLENGVLAADAITLIEESAAMGGSKYAIKWVALDPRIHYFPAVEMALANALLWVHPDLKRYLADDRVLLADLLVGVSRRISSDEQFYVYAACVGMKDIFGYCTVSAAVSAAHRDSENQLNDLGF